MQGLSKKKKISLIMIVYNFLSILALSHHCIFGLWHWITFLVMVFVGIVLVEVKQALVWSRPNARVFKVGWSLGLSGLKAQWPRLNERSYGGHVTQRAYLHGREHASTDTREKQHTLTVRWISYSLWFWCQYLDCSWHFRECWRPRALFRCSLLLSWNVFGLE